MSSVMIIGYNILQTYSEGLKPDILNSNFIHYPLQKFQKYDKPFHNCRSVYLFEGFKGIVY